MMGIGIEYKCTYNIMCLKPKGGTLSFRLITLKRYSSLLIHIGYLDAY